MVNNLKETRVNKYSTCLSYALDRTGLSGSYKFISEIPKEKFKLLDFSSLKVGDIVAWENKIPTSLFNTSIVSMQNYPVIIANLEDTSYHLGVVEKLVGNDSIIISDATRSLNNHYLTEIRLTLYNMLDRSKNESIAPKFVIKI